MEIGYVGEIYNILHKITRILQHQVHNKWIGSYSGAAYRLMICAKFHPNPNKAMARCN